MELDLELDVIEHEPTVLEYARFHGLCSDFTKELPSYYNNFSLSDETLYLDLWDPNDSPSLTNPADELTKERLAVSKEAAMLLKSVHSLTQEPPSLLRIPDRRRRILSLKQELPILRTDNELDILAFGGTVEPSFTDLKIPLEAIDEENDEGLDWPSDYAGYPKQCDERAKNEKLGVSRETLLYLQDAVRNSHSPEDSELIKREGLLYRKNTAIRPVTPPLLPLTPPLTPYIPSSPGNHLKLISDDSNSTAAEAKALEEQIMAADAFVQHNSDGSDEMLLDMLNAGEYDPGLDDINSPSTKRKASELKIEGPLTPLMFSESPAKKLKTVAFAEMLVEYIPDLSSRCIDENGHDQVYDHAHGYDSELPSNYENGNDILCPEDDYAFLKDVLEPAAKDANWRVENEQLSEADTTKRVPVPRVDFTLPVAPWDEFTRKGGLNAYETEIDAQARFLLWVKRNHMQTASSWHGVSELERTLPLAPFSHEAAKVSVEEKLHGEDTLTKMLADLIVGEVCTSSTDLWKRDGLRILEAEEPDEEMLEPADTGERKDMSSLIRKRQLDMQEPASDHDIAPRKKPSKPTVLIENNEPQREVIESHHWRDGSSMPDGNATHAIVNRSKDMKLSSNRDRPVQKQERDTSLMFGGKFSASSALDNFMALYGMTAKPNAREKNGPLPKRPPEPPLPSPIRPVEKARNPHNLSKAGAQPPQEAAQRPIDLPPLPESMPPSSFVISSTLLQRRSLSRQIESLYPDAEFVSRDFDSQYAVSKEADLILSPSTGLIITTLQQVKQRALPGQPDRSPVKERMKALQHMYERLVVLISEGLSRERVEQGFSQCSDPRDQEVITEYERTAAQLDGEVLIRHVPGGEQALARSIVGEMAQFGLPHGSKDIGDIKLLPDQTTWELFLRRAGLNAFAAQVILALLKNPVDWPQYSNDTSGATANMMRTCGLQTFLLMPTESRVQSFQAILGSSRILKRVSALLDEPWLSAAHGFQM
ncbi:uncharacterized protein N0V89_007647 [Didymosphaeria variabile]|uniref:Uncharacterized protein n=1 Tax=Didymosphaeria variabile TaxID=1932322 RepID=A0A9W9C9P1_9PLEO|nr:uncharacterized protein N0V89_007647 [Didymosphaeria variabile]KAJ4352299.1 hypothetical protein N0V89_007647 [Didymosphaeria variabile]